MLGPEGGVGTKAWGRGIDGGGGALAQAERKSSSAKQARGRMGTSLQASGAPWVKAGPPHEFMHQVAAFAHAHAMGTRAVDLRRVRRPHASL
jgi:hypothetical protein